jgi:trehalose 6-phosphate synthase
MGETMGRLVIVSNRVAPIEEGKQAAGGLVVGIREELAAKGGIWFGWSGEVLEKTATTPKIVRQGSITYATLGLGKTDYRDYYAGFSNGTLWPLLHFRLGLIQFDRQQFTGYVRVNRLFAARLIPLLRPDDVIWVQDYHLIPMAAELRQRGVKNRIGFFLHTPFPPPGILTALPHHQQVVEALTDYDLIGFQTAEDLRAFHDYIEREAGGSVDAAGVVEAFGRKCRAGAFPIGIDTEGFARLAADAVNSVQTRRLISSLTGRQLIIGVDRLDYSKGIPLRLQAYHRLLAAAPEFRQQVTYLQVTPPSRIDVKQYRDLKAEVETICGRISGHYAEYDWMPIRYLNRNLSRTMLAGFYRSARVGLVTPLRDGMNLVAKEFVAAQAPDDPGVLVLSRFAGAARELDAALLVNPFDTEEVSANLHRALKMPLAERRQRWETMMIVLRKNTGTHWFERFVGALTQPAERRSTKPAPRRHRAAPPA